MNPPSPFCWFFERFIRPRWAGLPESFFCPLPFSPMLFFSTPRWYSAFVGSLRSSPPPFRIGCFFLARTPLPSASRLRRARRACRHLFFFFTFSGSSLPASRGETDSRIGLPPLRWRGESQPLVLPLKPIPKCTPFLPAALLKQLGVAARRGPFGRRT